MDTSPTGNEKDKLQHQHPDTPVRMHMDDDDIKWRDSKPSYDQVNLKYLEERTRFHALDSLEKVVENLVKTWEMESTHKINAQDWKTIEPIKYRFRTNGGPPKTVDDNVRDGNYNLLLEASPLFDVSKETNSSSHALFKSAFPDGFAWELLELASGPPKVAFTWRHWTRWTGPFRGNPPTGELLELFGMSLVKVDDQLRITDLQVFFDPNPFIARLMKLDGKGAASTQQLMRGCPMAAAVSTAMEHLEIKEDKSKDGQ